MSLQKGEDTLDGKVGGEDLVGASMTASSESVDTGNSLGLEYLADVGTYVSPCIGELLTGATKGTGASVNGRRTAIGDEVAGAVVTTGAMLSDSSFIVGFAVLVVGNTTGAVDEIIIDGASVGSVGGDDDTSLPEPASPAERVGDMLGNSVYKGLRLASSTTVVTDLPTGGASVVSVERGPPPKYGKGSMVSPSVILLG